MKFQTDDISHFATRITRQQCFYLPGPPFWHHLFIKRWCNFRHVFSLWKPIFGGHVGATWRIREPSFFPLAKKWSKWNPTLHQNRTKNYLGTKIVPKIKMVPTWVHKLNLFQIVFWIVLPDLTRIVLDLTGIFLDLRNMSSLYASIPRLVHYSWI